MFNLKKQSKNVIKPVSKMVDSLNTDNKAEGSGTVEYLLKSNRKPNDGDAAYQKMLETKRSKSETEKITEGQMNDAGKGINNAYHRSKDEPKHPMDMAKDSSNDIAKQFTKEDKKIDKDTDFWDKYVQDQLLGENTKIVANKQPSQLLSNYDSRKDFIAQNSFVKKQSSLLRDADAMLYYIYRKAAIENRELNKEEKQIVIDINSGKIRVMSAKNEQDFSPAEWEKEMAFEASEKKAEDIENQTNLLSEINDEEESKQIDTEKLRSQKGKGNA